MDNLIRLLRQQRHKCIHRCSHIPGWFECDIFSIDKNHQFVEHELKNSLSDYKADFGKINRKQSKHGRLAFHDTRGPAFFWFVCDFEPPDLPDYAGWKLHNGTIKKRAPKLHTFKVGIGKIIHVANSMSYKVLGQ